MGESGRQIVGAGPLVETRLYVPRWRPGLVARPHLIKRLDQGIEGKLTVVSAPAGFGKTTLLAEWLSTSDDGDRSSAWVSLGESENDPTLFWTYIIAALQKIRPGIGESVIASLRSSQSPAIESLLAALLNEIAVSSATGDELVLVLDDYHLIDARAIHDGIEFLLDNMPREMHLVITSRADPPLPLARMRGRGELRELRAADLRFTSGEAAAFLNEVMGLDLRPDNVATLETRTEGWIAGLQLAAVSMQGRSDVSSFIADFAGNDRYIVDYLVEEVLQRQTRRVRSFLLQTSILDRLSGPLCDAVTGQEDGKEILEALERGNLFVVPLDDKRIWYRYHRLFAEVLQAHLTEEEAGRVSELHRRAAAWFEEHEMTVEAIEQARAADDHEAVARLLVTNFEEFGRAGRYTSISRWSASLPEEMVRKRPRLALIRARVALAVDNNNQAARTLTSWAEEAIKEIEHGGGLDPSDDIDGTVVGFEGLDALKGEVMAQKLFSARNLPPEEMLETAGRALELIPPSNYQVRGMIHMMGAGIEMSLGDLKSGLPGLERSLAEARRADNPAHLTGALTHLSGVYVALGRLEDGRRSIEEALRTAQSISAEASLLMCGPHTGLAEILLEQGDMARATEHAAKSLEYAGRSPTRSPVLFARTTAAQVYLAAGNTVKAMELLEEAEEFARGSRDSRFSSFLSSAQLKIYCQSGDLDAAANVVRDRRLSPDASADQENEEELTAYSRYLAARGEHKNAQRVLSKVLTVVQERGHVQHEIHALVLQALAYEGSGETELALESLGRATLLGEPGRFHRSLTGEGPAGNALLETLANAVRRGREPNEVGSPAYLAYLLRESGTPMDSAPVQAGNSNLIEPLTTREIEVLRLIAAGMRNQEIADHLFISLSTVKRHIANAYGKMNVSTRTRAVARANELNLLS